MWLVGRCAQPDSDAEEDEDGDGDSDDDDKGSFFLKSLAGFSKESLITDMEDVSYVQPPLTGTSCSSAGSCSCTHVRQLRVQPIPSQDAP